MDVDIDFMNSQEVATVYHDILDKGYVKINDRQRAVIGHAATIRRILKHLVATSDDVGMARLMDPIYTHVYPFIIDADLLKMIASHEKAVIFIKAIFSKYADVDIILRMIDVTTPMVFSDDGYRDQYGVVAMILNDARLTNALIDRYGYCVMQYMTFDLLANPFYHSNKDVIIEFVPSRLVWGDFNDCTRYTVDNNGYCVRVFIGYIIMYGSSRLIDHYIPPSQYHHPRVIAAMNLMVDDIDVNESTAAWLFCGPLYILTRGGSIVEGLLKHLVRHSVTIDAAFLARPWRITSEEGDKEVTVNVVDALTLSTCIIVRDVIMGMKTDDGSVTIKEVQWKIDAMKKRVMGERMMMTATDILIIAVAHE